MASIPPWVTVIRCPYRPEGCEWEYQREDAVTLSLVKSRPVQSAQVAGAFAVAGIQHLENQNQTTADAIREHLNHVHPGWSLDEIELRARMVAQPVDKFDGIVIEGEVS